MAKYTRETIYNPDGSIKKRVYMNDSASEESIFEKDTFSMPEDYEDYVDPIDPEVKFAEEQGTVIERDKYTINNEQDIFNIFGLLINKLRDLLVNKN